MLYLTWRNDHEDQILKKVNDAELEDLPAWKVTAAGDVADQIVSPTVEKMLTKGMNPVDFSCVFGEYLYEVYNVAPLDIELFTQMIMKSYLVSVVDRQTYAIKMAIKETFNNVRPLLSDEDKIKLDEIFKGLGDDS